MRRVLRFRYAVPLAGLLVCFGLLFPASGVADENADYRAGVATIDVTPDYPIRLNGFGGRREESEGVTQRIFAKALAVSQADEQPIVIVTLDSLGIRITMVDEVAARLQTKTGLPRQNFLVAFSHSHTTPKVNGASDTIFSQPIPPEHQTHIDRYTIELTNKIEQAALAAVADRQPARLNWSVGSVGFAKNRRTPGGPVDHDLPVLVVRGPDDKVRAVYVTYACHCVTLSHNKISGDWAGYAQELIERKFPGAVALVSIGAGSDSNPDSGVTGDKVDVATAQGAQIADEVSRLLEMPLRPISGKLVGNLRRIPLPLNDPPDRQALQQMIEKGGPHGYNAQVQLARLEGGEALLTKIDYAIQTVLFGDDLAMVFLAGEVCVDYATRLKSELDRQRIWVHGYSNDFCAYIPSERLLAEGGYGGGGEIPYFALPNTFRPGLEQPIIDEVKRQVPQSFRVKPGTQGVPPQSPSDSLRSLRTHPKLQIELVASEPLVDDPVAIDFGLDGRLWVAEMVDYARAVDEEFVPAGRIKVLADTDGDGQYDQPTVFLDGLRFPTEVKVWRGGVLVCDAPQILFAQDTDGDGKADVRRELFTGFETHNPHARVNSLRFGLDNWLYGSGGIFGGKITSFAGQTVDVTNRDFRMNPDTGDIEPVTGQSQQGRVRDDWGNWFGCDNSTLLRHYPLEDRYLRRNPYFTPPPSGVYVPSYPNSAQLYPLSELVLFKLSGPAGRPTSACGVEIYRDDLLGPEYAGNSFVCEPVNQLVHRLILSRRRTAFQGRRADNEQASEFLASTDRWFRPVQVRTGPDGGLWIVDMYRYVIEHPRWIPDETRANLDTFAGRGMGRIYRIRPRNLPLHRVPRFDQLSVGELCAALDHPNGPQRDLAHQALLWRGATEAAEQLADVAAEGKHAAGRLQALCVMQGLGGSRAATIYGALLDKSPEVRSHALRLYETAFEDNRSIRSQRLWAGAEQLAADPNPAVQLQLAYSLGETEERKAGQLLGQLLERAEDDSYLLAAGMSSVNPQNVLAVLGHVLGADRVPNDVLLDSLLNLVVKLDDDQATRRVLEDLLRPRGEEGDYPLWQEKALAVVVAAARDGEVHEQLSEQARQQLQTVRQQAIEAVREGKEEDRVAGVALLARGWGHRPEDLQRVAEVIAPQNPVGLQVAAIEALSQAGHELVPGMLLAAWSSATPAVRGPITDALLGRENWTPALLTALESGVVLPADIDPTRRSRLAAHTDPAAAARAARLFQTTRSPDRKSVVEQYRAATQRGGLTERGRQLYGKACANCHKLGEVGHVVGPDLAALTTRTAEALLVAIFDPNADVDARYLNYVAVREDGTSVTGMLADETTTSLTIVEQGDKRHTLLRSELEQLRGTGKSLMPDGLEKDLSVEDTSDLLAYLMSLGPPSKEIEGNHPTPVAADDNGQLSLLATNGEIFGGEITFESPFRNIGMWHGENDRVSWDIEGVKPAKYDVYLDYACDSGSAGNVLRLEAAEPLRWKVAPTGGWDQYRQVRIGSIDVPPGFRYLVAKPDAGLTRALIDLRGIYLVPAGRPPVYLAQRETPSAPATTEPAPTEPAGIARMILDEAVPSAQKEKGIADHPELAAQLVSHMTGDLQPEAQEEYRRIPWIWRVAIAAGRRNDRGQLGELLRVSLPQPGEPLRDWQAVVVGGGIINGVSLTGTWPRVRLDELLEGDEPLSQRWQETLRLATKMTDDEKVPTGTRYDALRIVALDRWEESGKTLAKYLVHENEELQMGAVSGLVDVDLPDATKLLIEHAGRLAEGNRNLALNGLLRSEDRVEALLAAVEAGKIERGHVGAERAMKLREHPNEMLRVRARRLLGQP